MLKLTVKPFPAIHDTSANVLYKQYGPRSDCSYSSRLIWIHSVCFHGKKVLECIQIYAASSKSHMHYLFSPWEIVPAILSSAEFVKINLFEKFFQ